MKKAQLPLIAELDLGDTGDFTVRAASKFTGTDNPRHLRVLRALMPHSLRREEIDSIAGASNGPELVAELRRRGLEMPCYRVPVLDRDGFVVRIGIYALTEADRRKVSCFLAKKRGRA